MTDAPPHRIAAILPCTDLEASTAFYEQLGLRVSGDYGTYRLMEDDEGWQLHLHTDAPEGWFDPRSNPFGLYLYTARVAELAARVQGRILEPEKAPTHKPWGMYEFAMSDPDETLVRVGWPSELITPGPGT